MKGSLKNWLDDHPLLLVTIGLASFFGVLWFIGEYRPRIGYFLAELLEITAVAVIIFFFLYVLFRELIQEKFSLSEKITTILLGIITLVLLILLSD